MMVALRKLRIKIDPSRLPGVWVYRDTRSPRNLVAVARWGGSLGAINGDAIFDDVSDSEWRAVQNAARRYNASHAKHGKVVWFDEEVLADGTP